MQLTQTWPGAAGRPMAAPHGRLWARVQRVSAPGLPRFYGPIALVDIPGKGRGLVCTTDVTTGQLLLVSQPVAMVTGTTDVSALDHTFAHGQLSQSQRHLLHLTHGYSTAGVGGQVDTHRALPDLGTLFQQLSTWDSAGNATPAPPSPCPPCIPPSQSFRSCPPAAPPGALTPTAPTPVSRPSRVSCVSRDHERMLQTVCELNCFSEASRDLAAAHVGRTWQGTAQPPGPAPSNPPHTFTRTTTPSMGFSVPSSALTPPPTPPPTPRNNDTPPERLGCGGAERVGMDSAGALPVLLSSSEPSPALDQLCACAFLRAAVEPLSSPPGSSSGGGGSGGSGGGPNSKRGSRTSPSSFQRGGSSSTGADVDRPRAAPPARESRDPPHVRGGAHVGLWTEHAWMNHSCAPNVVNYVVGSCMVVRAARNLPAGTELQDTYLGAELTQPLHVRRAQLQRHYGFHCACSRCVAEEQLTAAAVVGVAPAAGGCADVAPHVTDVASSAHPGTGGPSGRGGPLRALATTLRGHRWEARVKTLLLTPPASLPWRPRGRGTTAAPFPSPSAGPPSQAPLQLCVPAYEFGPHGIQRKGGNTVLGGGGGAGAAPTEFQIARQLRVLTADMTQHVQRVEDAVTSAAAALPSAPPCVGNARRAREAGGMLVLDTRELRFALFPLLPVYELIHLCWQRLCAASSHALRYEGGTQWLREQRAFAAARVCALAHATVPGSDLHVHASLTAWATAVEAAPIGAVVWEEQQTPGVRESGMAGGAEEEVLAALTARYGMLGSAPSPAEVLSSDCARALLSAWL